MIPSKWLQKLCSGVGFMQRCTTLKQGICNESIKRCLTPLQPAGILILGARSTATTTRENKIKSPSAPTDEQNCGVAGSARLSPLSLSHVQASSLFFILWRDQARPRRARHSSHTVQASGSSFASLPHLHFHPQPAGGTRPRLQAKNGAERDPGPWGSSV